MLPVLIEREKNLEKILELAAELASVLESEANRRSTRPVEH